jgi:arylsulfatase A-like enzyme
MTKQDFNHIVARYDSEVTYTDAQLGRLFDRLKELDLWDETMIILTSDHGESFEHDYFFNHSARVYQSCIHVPLIIKPFGRIYSGRVDALCSNTDIFPTVCEALNLSVPKELDGVSLSPFLNGTGSETFVPHQFLLSESYPFSNGLQSIGRTYSIIRGDHKLIYSPNAFPVAPTYQLFDLSAEPNEEDNLYDSLPELSNELFTPLKQWVLEDKGVAQGVSGRIEREALKTLQYLN